MGVRRDEGEKAIGTRDKLKQFHDLNIACSTNPNTLFVAVLEVLGFRYTFLSPRALTP